MGASQGILNIFSFFPAASATQRLTIQVPIIQISAPTPSPQATTGAQGEIGPPSGKNKRRSSDTEDAQGVKRTAVEPPKPTVDSHTHFNRTYVPLKRLSEGDNGETFAAISKSHLIQIVGEHQALSEESILFFDDVRDHMVAVKFAKPNNLEGDLTNEIKFLTEEFPFWNPSINFCIDSHLDGDCQWLVLPYASGGSLESFTKACPKDLTLSFRWHIAAQMTQGLLFLFFGAEDFNNLPQKAPDSCSVVHGDIFTGNTLLGAPDPSGPTNFPRCIISDFGRADSAAHLFDLQVLPKLANTRMRRLQSDDISQLGIVLHHLTVLYINATNPCPHNGFTAAGSKFIEVDGFCLSCLETEYGVKEPEGPAAIFQEWTEKLMDFGSWKNDFSDAYDFLCSLLKVAQEQRAATYEPMSTEAMARLSSPYVSNQDLAQALGILERSPANASRGIWR